LDENINNKLCVFGVSAVRKNTAETQRTQRIKRVTVPHGPAAHP